MSRASQAETISVRCIESVSLGGEIYLIMIMRGLSVPKRQTRSSQRIYSKRQIQVQKYIIASLRPFSGNLCRICHKTCYFTLRCSVTSSNVRILHGQAFESKKSVFQDNTGKSLTNNQGGHPLTPNRIPSPSMPSRIRPKSMQNPNQPQPYVGIQSLGRSWTTTSQSNLQGHPAGLPGRRF